MEEKIINMNQFLGAAQGDREHMLGKFLYFSLANLLVDKDELSSLCESMGIPYTGQHPAFSRRCVPLRHRRYPGACSGHGRR